MKTRIAFLMALGLSVLIISGCTCPRFKEAEGNGELPEPMVAEPEENPCAAPAMGRIEQAFPMDEAIKIEKMAPKRISTNQAFDYRIKVTNLTNQTLRNVRVRDRLGEGLEIQSSNPEVAQMEQGSAMWVIGDLEPEASEMITISAVANQKGTFVSCADVYYESPTCAKIEVVEPQLRLSRSAPQQVLQCDRIPVVYTVTNEGDGYACDLRISESLPDYLTTAQGQRQIDLSIDSLGPGQSEEYEVMLDASQVGEFTGQAKLFSRVGGTVESNMTTTMVTVPQLSLAQSGPDRQYLGRTVTYQITVSNRGNGLAREATLIAGVPEDVEFIEASQEGDFSRSSPGRVKWELGTIEPGQSKSVTMTLSSEQAGMLQSNVTATAYCAEDATSMIETNITGISALLLEVVDLQDPVEIGQTSTYEITVTNQGTAAASNIRVSCQLEEPMQYVSSTGQTEASVRGNNINFQPLSSLEPKAKATWQVQFRAIGEQDVRFRTSLQADQLERPVIETESTTLYR